MIKLLPDLGQSKRNMNMANAVNTDVKWDKLLENAHSENIA